MKKKVAVVAGGFSHEAQISLKSSETILKHLSTDKYELVKIIISEKGWYAYRENQEVAVDKNDFSVDFGNGKILFDVAFIIIHGTPGEDGKLQAYFEMLDIPFTTCGSLASAITFNKYTCNSLLKQFGIRCAESLVVRKNETINPNQIASKIGFPMFVKPCDGGSSFGVSKVKNKEEIISAVNNAVQHGTEALIESFISGTEVTCGIFKIGTQITVLPATEIVSKNEFFDFDAKYKGDSEEITPARISNEMMKEIQSITQKTYELLNLRGLSRIDFIIQNDIPYLIEVNTVPGMSAQSIIPQQAKVAGFDLSQLLENLVEDAILNLKK